MIGWIAFALPVIAFVGGALYLKLVSGEKIAKKKSLLILTVSLGIISGYIICAAHFYNKLTKEYGKNPTSCEGEYFAFQTLTTVGYGAFLCDTTSVELSKRLEFRHDFHRMSCLAMLFGPVIWIIVVSVLISFFKKWPFPFWLL